MYISPKHNTATMTDKPVSEWETEFMIEFFFERIDGWHLKIADHCINGWRDEAGKDYIQGKHRDGSPANYIADSGWAVLQIVLNYFEIIAFIKRGGYRGSKRKNNINYQLFGEGVLDVFSEYENSPDKTKVIDALYYGLRVGLYHGDAIRVDVDGETVLEHKIDSFALKFDNDLLIIDPHLFVRKLRNHLSHYCDMLMDKSQTDLRNTFRDGFLAKYGT
jgi:hypothetical protein